jgi:endo-1,4-beta-xylanase
MSQHLSRRAVLTRTGLALAGSLYRLKGAACEGGVDISTPLKVHASRKGLLFGSAASQRYLKSDPAYAALFAQQCGVLVPEGELKWNVLRPTPDSYNFGPADWMYEFTRTHNLKFRGHTLAWWQALPGWFSSYANQGNARRLLEEHIATVVGRYSGKMHSWDVVNEVVDPYDKRADGLKTKPWLELAGPEYIDFSFQSARAADPNALLVWNENHLEINDTWSRGKRKALLSLLAEKLKRKIPIDAVGLQTHVSTTDPSFDNKEFKTFVRKIADLGLRIIISEIDVIDHDAPANTSIRDEKVAGTYSNYLDLILKEKQVIAVLTWGLSDKYSWLAKFKPREDGLPVRTLPFDDCLAGKKAFTAIANAFDWAPDRSPMG